MNQISTRSGFVVAGGQSSRMGSDKAFLEWEGKPLIERALDTLRTVCSDVAIVGARTKFARYGTVVEDVYPGSGPLAGIHAGLLHSGADLNFMLAVDMPFVSQHLLRFLFGIAENERTVVTAPRLSGRFQPLCAAYRRSFVAPAEQALREGKNKIDALFAGLRVRIVEEDELAAAGFSAALFRNLNTPEDLHSARLDSLSS